MEPVLQVSQLCRTFALTSREVPATRSVDLRLHEGEFVCIMGASGSGKSTLLYLLSGLDKADSGSIHFRGQPIHQLSEDSLATLRRTAFGFVFQSINLVPTLSILENIQIAGFLQKGPRKQVRGLVYDTAMQLLTTLEIEHLAHQLPSQSSGGEQQRAAVARALINRPAILFADEPTGALNHASGQNLLDHFNRIHREGQSIVMVSHDLKAASRADRVIYMRDGQISGDFTFDKPLQNGETDLPAREQALLVWLKQRAW